MKTYTIPWSTDIASKVTTTFFLSHGGVFAKPNWVFPDKSKVRVQEYVAKLGKKDPTPAAEEAKPQVGDNLLTDAQLESHYRWTDANGQLLRKAPHG